MRPNGKVSSLLGQVGSIPAIDDYARIAQWLEHGPAEPRVPGSNLGTSFFFVSNSNISSSFGEYSSVGRAPI